VLFMIARPNSFTAAVVPFEKGKATGPIREVLSDAQAAQFVAPGHLVFWRGEDLLAVPFDLSSLTVTGPAAPALGASRVSYSESSFLSVSATGTLVYAPRLRELSPRRLVWVDRAGIETPLDVPVREYVDPAISPDGQKITFAVAAAKVQQVWVHELKSGASTRLTFEEALNMAPTWSPDGLRIAYTVAPGTAVVSRLADGSGSPVTIAAEGASSFPTSWSPDGKTLAMQSWDGMDVKLLRCEEGGGTKGPCRLGKWVATGANEHLPYFSPDGKYLAYVSDESGREEVYVQPFPDRGGKWQVSSDGGSKPRWARNGKELFYRIGNALMAVPVGSSSRPFGVPKKLFEAVYATSEIGSVGDYDVGPDGRFLFMKPMESSSRLTLELVLNWPTELARLAQPVAKK